MAVNVQTDTAEPFPSRNYWPACADVGASISGAYGLGNMACPAGVQVRSDFLADDPAQVGPQEKIYKIMLMMVQVQLAFHSVGV